MSTARRLSTNLDAVTAWPGRAAVALALSVATLAALPAAAEAQDDPITIRFQRSAESVHEGDPLGLSVLFSEPPGRVVPDDEYFVTIGFTLTPQGGARYQRDYWGNGSIKVHNFENDLHFVGFGFFPSEDDVVDPGESVLIAFDRTRLPDGFVIGEPSTVEVTILDGPSPPPVSTMVTLSASPDSVSEGAGSTRVTVTGTLNSAARDSDTPVAISVDNGTAIAGTDFATVNDFTLTIPANETRGTATFDLVPTNDEVDESDETLSVTGSATGLAVDSATMTITDNDAASSRVTLSVNPTAVSEGAGSTTVTVTGTLDEGARTSATPVTVSVGGGTATAGTDFATVNDFTLTIPANQTEGTQTFALIPTDDNIAESAESLTVSGSATGLTVDSATLEITDNDTASTKVALSVDPTSVSEGAGSTTVTVTGTLDGGARTSATPVAVSVGGGTATSGTDFATVNDFTLTIPANQTEGTQTFRLIPTDDDVAEGTETLTVRGSTNDLAVDSTTLTINDNDTASTKVTLSVDPTSVSEGAGSTTVTVTGTLDGGARTSATPVAVSVGGGTATSGTDFATVNDFTLTIPANQTEGTQTFRLIPTDDDVAEGTETLTVRGSTNDLAVDSTTLTINDNDTASTKVTLSVDPTSVSEGAGSTTVTVTGTLDGGARTSATPVAVSVGGGTATSGTDFATVNDFTLTIPANQTEGTQTFRLIPTDDDVAEGTETLTVRGSTNDLAVDSTTLTINDNDTASNRVTLSVDPTSVSEGAGSTTVTVTGTLNGGASTSATPVTVSVDSGTATSGTDFATVNDFTLTIPADATEGTQTFSLNPTDDDVAEGAETLTVSGSTTTGLAVDSATLTINDNDTASTRVTLSVDPTSVSEGDAATTVTVTGTLDGGASTTDRAVTVSVGDGTAVAGTDFDTVNDFTLTIPANATSGTATFTLTPTDDNLAEGAETLWVNGDVAGLAVDPATLAINDNDTASAKVILSVNPTSVSEGDGSTTITVTGTLDKGARTVDTSVSVSVDSGTATAGTDFATVNDFTLTIPANAISATETFGLAPTDDNLAEGAETLAVTGSATGLTVDPATVTINDNDTASTRVTLSVDPTSVAEGDSSTTVTVTGTLDASARPTATPVAVLVGDGTAMAGMDFTPVNSFTLTIPVGATSGTATFTLTPTNDNVAEDNETVTVGGSATASRLTVDPATVTIIDNDTASTKVILTLNPGQVGEGDRSTTVTVTGTLDEAARAEATSVTVSVADGTATSGADFTPVSSFTLTIPAKATSGQQTFALIPTDDGVAEGTETVTVSGTSSLSVDSATLRITDNDTQSTRVTLTLNPTQVSEGAGSATVTVTGTLDEAASSGPTSVTVSVADGTAMAGSDFTAVNSFTLTIPAGVTAGSQTFSLRPTDDNVAEGPETLTVTGDASGLTVEPATLTITDNDTPSTKVTLTVSPPRIAENASRTTVTVTGRLNRAARTGATSVTVTVDSGTAVSGTDFTPVNSFTLTIPTGATVGSQTFSLSPTDDNVHENDETVAVNGTADLTVDATTLVIVDDDAAPTKITLSVNPAAVAEGGSAPVTVTGTLDGTSLSTATSVTVTVDSGTAVSGTDFPVVASFTLTIAAESMSGFQAFNFAPTNDEVAEGDETVLVSGSTSTSGLTVDSATLGITDNDALPTRVTLSVSPDAVSEGAASTTVTVTATLNGAALPGSTDVTVSVEDGTAISGKDFTGVPSFALTIPAESKTGTKTFSLTPAEDNVFEGAETVTVSGEASDLPVDSATITINDNDTASANVTLSVDPDAVEEDAGSPAITVTATLADGTRTTATDVTVSVGGGTAMAEMDFTPVDSFTLTIPRREGERHAGVHPDRDRRRDRRGRRVGDGERSGVRPDGRPGDGDDQRQRHRVGEDHALGGPGYRRGGRDRDDGHRYRDAERCGPPRCDGGDGVGRGRHGHGGHRLRRRLGLHPDHSRQGDERPGDVQPDPGRRRGVGRRRDGGGERKRVRPDRRPDGGHDHRQRHLRGGDAGPVADGGRGGRRRHGHYGDRGAGGRRAEHGDDGDRVRGKRYRDGGHGLRDG